MRNNHLDQLKRLKAIPVPPESLDHGRMKLLAFMSAHPLVHQISVPWWKNAFVWKPAAAFAMMSVAVGGSAMTVSASGGSMPGGSLYRVKLLAEEVRTKFAFTPEAQFRAEARHAERRLDEMDVVMHLTNSTTATREQRLKATMERYQNHVAALNMLASKLTDDIDDHGRAELSASVAAHEVENVLARHESLVESASTSAETDDDLVVNAKTTLELEEKVMKIFGDRAERQQKAHEHADALRKRLEKIQARAKESTDADTPEHLDHADDGHAHEHVEVAPPAVVLPFINQTGIHLRGELRAGLQTNINVENASTR